MVTAKKSAIIYMVLLSLALLVPSLMIAFIDHQARSNWERRKLDTLPSLSDVIDNPKAGFKQFDGWMNDHVGFGFQAIRFRKRFLYETLGVTGDKYIVRNNSGDLFLTGRFNLENRDYPFKWFKRNCSKLLNPEYTKKYIENLSASNEVLSRFGAKTIFTAVPTKSVLLTDRLPASTPQNLVQDCKKINSKNNGLMVSAKQLPTVNTYYPHDVFKTRTSADPLFFPNSAYHWAGESNWAFVEDFAETYNLKLPPTWPKGPCVSHKVRWDIGLLMGVSDVVDGCNRDKRELRLNTYNQFGYPVGKPEDGATASVFAMTNPYAANDKRAVMISNSFGPLVREQFAGLFKTTYHINLNRTRNDHLISLLHDSDVLDTDYVVIIVADFHYPDFLDTIK